MAQYVVFLRAVNVAPRWVPMADLREALTGAGFADVETHIQTGNVHLSTPMRSAVKVASAVEAVVQERFGLHADTMVRTPARLREILAVAEAAPRAEGESRRYVSFAQREPGAVPELVTWAEPGETALVDGAEVHWGLAGTIHSSRLGNARIERLIGCPATARDIKVLRALVAKWA